MSITKNQNVKRDLGKKKKKKPVKIKAEVPPLKTLLL